MRHSQKNQLNLNIDKWYQKPAGQALLEVEQNAISHLPIKFFGHYLLQLGGSNDLDLLKVTGVQKQIYLNPNEELLPARCDYSVVGNFVELPFLPTSIDVAVLMHILEFDKNPRQILEEIFKVLLPEGYVIIFGFNPYSLAGLNRLFQNKKQAPYNGHFISAHRLKHWLQKAGFSIIHYQTLFFRPFLKTNYALKKYLFLESFGPMFYTSFGNVYLLVAQKKVVALTPLKNKLGRRFAPLPQTGFVKPAT